MLRVVRKGWFGLGVFPPGEVVAVTGEKVRRFRREGVVQRGIRAPFPAFRGKADKVPLVVLRVGLPNRQMADLTQRARYLRFLFFKQIAGPEKQDAEGREQDRHYFFHP